MASMTPIWVSIAQTLGIFHAPSYVTYVALAATSGSRLHAFPFSSNTTRRSQKQGQRRQIRTRSALDNGSSQYNIRSMPSRFHSHDLAGRREGEETKQWGCSATTFVNIGISAAAKLTMREGGGGGQTQEGQEGTGDRWVRWFGTK